MSECERIGKWIGGCRFEPRYDVGEPKIHGKITGYDLPAVLEASKPKTYIHDICIRCGKIVKPEVVVTNELAPTSPNPNRSE